MPGVISDSVSNAQKEQAEKQKEITIEIISRVATVTYDRAMAYTNIVIIAGYAAAFTVWSFTKNHLPEWAMLSTALLLIISVSVFVAFETFKMILNSRHIMKMGSVVKPAQTFEQFQKALNDHKAEETRQMLWMVRVWVPTLVIVISTGYGAIGILAYNFLLRLIKMAA